MKNQKNRNSRPQRKSTSKPSQKLPQRVIEGFVKRHPDGFGFLISDDPKEVDVYIPRHSMDGVMANDRVRVKVTQEQGGDRFRGEVQEIIGRSVKRVIGQFLQHRPGYGLLMDKSLAWGSDMKVEVPKTQNVKDKDWVAAEILTYPESPEGFTGRVVSVIGDVADPQNDSLRVLHSHSIPFEFSKEALKEAEKLPDEVSRQEFPDRRDISDMNLITIDGATAKDFDDAVYVESNAAGFRLVVAIADVSHYVKPNTPLDEDAYERGNSTYFPSFVAPMLPEKLSNGLCSLRPNVYRLCMVADMKLGFQGELLSSEFYEGIMKSKARVTYGEAQEVIDGSTPEKFKHVEKNILKARDLANVLMAKRYREGSLDLDLPETEIQLDETGTPVDILQSERLFSHRLIEEMMLMANVAVARFFKEKNIQALYRIHEEPKGEAIEKLSTYLNAFGFNENVKSGALQKKLSKALQHFKDHPKETIVSMLLLRSLAQAKYSAQDVGHFGLAFPDYTHFTSPIRRYADLVVHRLLKSLVYPKKGYKLVPEAQLETIGTMISATEQRSVKAERQVKSIKKARFMSKFLGQEFEGAITSVARFGVFVQLRQYDVDGLVRLELLGPGKWEFDEENLMLVDKKSKRSFELGQPMKVQVVRVDIETGQIDFLPVGPDMTEPIPRGNERSGESRSRREGRKDRRGDDSGESAAGGSSGKAVKGSQLFSVRKYGSDSKDKKSGKSSENRGGFRKKRVSGSRKKSSSR